MRIASGHLKGRIFDAPGGHRTRPMSDKLKSAIFNVLGDISGLTVLDAFAGTGALSFEAISRGVSSAVLIEHDKRAVVTLQKNIEQLGLSDVAKLTPAYTRSWSTRHKAKQFELIFADPPFDDLQEKTIGLLPDHLAPGGTLILNFPARERPPYELNKLNLVKQKTHGTSQLLFYKHSD